MKPFRWNPEKNMLLKQTRGVCFDDIADGTYIEDRNHRNRANQRELVVKIHWYVYLVPYVEEEEYIFLKTMFPSRIENKKFIS